VRGESKGYLGAEVIDDFYGAVTYGGSVYSDAFWNGWFYTKNMN
jgi:hypothetical protein